MVVGSDSGSDVMGKGRDKRRRAKLVKAIREKIKAQAKA